MLNLPRPRLSPSALKITRLPLHGGIARQDLIVEIEPGTEEGLLVHVERSFRVIDDATARAIGEGLREALRELVERPDRRVADLLHP
jgi:hypothetical protein